jgi:hypothetical protein
MRDSISYSDIKNAILEKYSSFENTNDKTTFRLAVQSIFEKYKCRNAADMPCKYYEDFLKSLKTL